MTHLRAAKVDGIAADIAPLEVDDPSGDAELLVLGWGSSRGLDLGRRRSRPGGRRRRSRPRTCAG